jgi:hypothetical protein
MRKDKQIYNQKLWVEGFRHLLSSNNLGLLLSAVTLLLGTIKIHGSSGYEEFIDPLINIFQRMPNYAQEYYYYVTPCPWL